MFTWGHRIHVEAQGQLRSGTENDAFRGAEGAAITCATRMGQMVSREFKKCLEEAGLPLAELGCNTLRHM